MVFTEHSNFGHANAGGALREHDEVLKARAENLRLLIFQGLEWYLPAAEHATVFTAPGPNEADVLRQFELAFDGKLLGRSEGSPGHPDPAGNEALASVATASRANFHGELPKLAHLDVIRGAVRGPAGNRDEWRARRTRGSSAPSRSVAVPARIGLGVDPHGPVVHTPGDGDPWLDTWLYTNPIFVDVG